MKADPTTCVATSPATVTAASIPEDQLIPFLLLAPSVLASLIHDLVARSISLKEWRERRGPEAVKRGQREQGEERG